MSLFVGTSFSLAEVNILSHFLLRGTQRDRRCITVHTRGPPAIHGECTRRPKLKKNWLYYPGDVFRATKAFAGLEQGGGVTLTIIEPCKIYM